VNFSYISIGALHLPVYGLFAAVGLIAALLLTQRTARAVGLPPDKVWNAGMFAVVSAFVVSRVLLVVFSFAMFRAEPMLVMAQPSLTYTGVAITGVLSFLYLRWQGLPVLAVADAFAPSAMVVWFALSLGHFFEGTDAGMPTRLPWGVTMPDDTMLGRVHPVQIYAALAAVGLGVWLLRQLPRRRQDGVVAARGLVAGGLISFLLGFLRQPVETYGDALLDPAQAAALLLMLAGEVMLAMPAHRSEETVDAE